MEFFGREIDRSRVVQSRWICGSRGTGHGEEKRRKQQQQRFHGVSLAKEYCTDEYGLPMRGD
jgi:hypothetical protein